jgi:hypothetical protein
MRNQGHNFSDNQVNDGPVSRGKWILVLVAYDDEDLEPQVLKERLARDEDEQLAAFLRGGELVAVLGDDNEAIVEAHRVAVEKECLRIR